jgi:hypothetical protein
MLMSGLDLVCPVGSPAAGQADRQQRPPDPGRAAHLGRQHDDRALRHGGGAEQCRRAAGAGGTGRRQRGGTLRAAVPQHGDAEPFLPHARISWPAAAGRDPVHARRFRHHGRRRRRQLVRRLVRDRLRQQRQQPRQSHHVRSLRVPGRGTAGGVRGRLQPDAPDLVRAPADRLREQLRRRQRGDFRLGTHGMRIASPPRKGDRWVRGTRTVSAGASRPSPTA